MPAGLELPADDKAHLLQLTPATYTGRDGQLVRYIGTHRGGCDHTGWSDCYREYREAGTR